MECRNCFRFTNSKWRINNDEAEGSRSHAPKLRHCNIVNKYISGDKEICEHFEPNPLFFCDRNIYWQHADACMNRVKKNLDETCVGCSQYKVIVDLQKARHFYQLKLKRQEQNPVEVKPTLKRRTL